MKRWIILILVIAVILGVKFVFFGGNEKESGSNSKDKGTQPVSVNYFVVKPVDFSDKIFATGKVGSLNQVEIMPEVPGKVVEIHFREGESVSKGALLIKINDAELQAQLVKTRVQLKLAEEKSGRLKKLLAVNGVSREESDMQENEVASLKADEAFLQAQLDKTSIRAPFSGIAGLKNISEGAFVSPGTSIVSLVQTKPLYIEFSVPEKYINLVEKGANIGFAPERAGPDDTLIAKVFAIEPKVDESTRTIRLRAMYDGKKELYPGAFVKVFLNLKEVKNALMLPSQCVIPTLKGQKVFRYNNGTAFEVPVAIGIRTETKVQVLEGLVTGDTIVATGLLSVKDGSMLNLIKETR